MKSGIKSPRSVKRILGIFAKAPQPGQVKTRLAAETTAEWAAEVADALLHDTIQRTTDIGDQRILAYTPDSARTFFKREFPGLALEAQGGGDLGQRMQRFLKRHLRAGGAQVVLIGTDSPTVPLDYLHQAIDLLDAADIVLGPATDGGYYLIGCSGPVPPIFEGIAWGTNSVFRDTVVRLPASCRLALLPPWYDVDTLADWKFLAAHAGAMRRAGMDPRIRHAIGKKDPFCLTPPPEKD